MPWANIWARIAILRVFVVLARCVRFAAVVFGTRMERTFIALHPAMPGSLGDEAIMHGVLSETRRDMPLVARCAFLLEPLPKNAFVLRQHIQNNLPRAMSLARSNILSL